MNAWIDNRHETPAHVSAHLTHETSGRVFHWRATYIRLLPGFFCAGVNTHISNNPHNILVICNFIFSRLCFELDVTPKESQ